MSGQPFRLLSGNIMGFSRQSGALFVWVVYVLGGKASLSRDRLKQLGEARNKHAQTCAMVLGAHIWPAVALAPVRPSVCS